MLLYLWTLRYIKKGMILVNIDNEAYNEPIKVYVRTDKHGNITEIASSVFLKDNNGWTEIDSGYGDKYSHAQNNYFDNPLIDDEGRYNYRLINGKPVFLKGVHM